MWTMHSSPVTAGRRLRLAAASAAMIALTATAGCENLLDVELPTRVPEETLNDPSMSRALVAGAAGDFECAYSEFVHATGLWVDEFINGAGWREVTQWSQRLGNEYDTGSGRCPTTVFRGGHSVYLPLQIARAQAERATTLITGFPDNAVPDKTKLLATAAAYAGYTYVLLSEPYCEVTFDGGAIMAPVEGLKLAETRFTTAIDLAQKAGDNAILNMARVGRARVRIDLGKKAEAAADARLVPAGFVFNATYSTTIPRRMNSVNNVNNTNQAISVDPRFRNLTVDGVPDPRVVVADAKRKANDSFTDLWVQMNYTSLSSPIPLATWDEAQLIIAEAEGGQAAVDAINRIRDKHKLPRFSGGSAAQIQAQLIEERRRTLFLQGHRLSDHLRFKLPFDTGVNHKGTLFSDATCLPLPEIERKG